MIGIVIVAHNPKLADEIIRFCKELKKYDFQLINGGGIEKDRESFGTSPEVIAKSVKLANQGEGVIVLCDLGSSLLNAQKAKKLLGDSVKMEIVDAPIVEGAVVAVSANCPKISFETLKSFIKEAKSFDKL